MKNLENKNNELSGILSIEELKQTNKRIIPPLQNWSPKATSFLDIVITDAGEWYHEGTKMTRQSLVDLFASVLWCQSNEMGQKTYFLKTPTDYYQITVEDVPLFVNRVEVVQKQGVDWVVFGTTHGDWIELTEQAPLYFRSFDKQGVIEQRLYIDTRFNLTARIERNVFFHLVELGELSECESGVCLSLQSGGVTHTLISKDVP